MKNNTQKIIDELKDEAYTLEELRNMNAIDGNKRLIFESHVLKAISKIDIEHKKEVEDLQQQFQQSNKDKDLLFNETNKLRQQLQKANKEINNLQELNDEIIDDKMEANKKTEEIFDDIEKVIDKVYYSFNKTDTYFELAYDKLRKKLKQLRQKHSKGK